MQQFFLYQYRAKDRSHEGSITGYYKAEMMGIGTAYKLRRAEDAV